MTPNGTTVPLFLQLKETELAARKKPEQWGNDFAAEPSAREEGKRASSPSPSDGQSSSAHSGIAIQIDTHYLYINLKNRSLILLPLHSM